MSRQRVGRVLDSNIPPPWKGDSRAIVLRVEEEVLSVRVYDIGQSRDSRCRYKFNVDLVMQDKDYPASLFPNDALCDPVAFDIRRLDRTGRFVIALRLLIHSHALRTRVKVVQKQFNSMRT